MNRIELWLGKESNLLLVGCGVYSVFGIGYMCLLHKNALDIVSLAGCFVVSCIFLFFRLLVTTSHAHQEDTRKAAIKRRIEEKMTKAFAESNWHKVAMRYSFITWGLCSGAFLAYAGFRNIVVQPWHALLGACAVLFAAGAIVLVFVSDRDTNIAEEDPDQKDSGEEQ